MGGGRRWGEGEACGWVEVRISGLKGCRQVQHIRIRSLKPGLWLPVAQQPCSSHLALFSAGEERRVVVDQDDGIRPGTTAASLAQLRPVFKKGGTTTAGNSSQVCGVAGFEQGGGHPGQLVARSCKQLASDDAAAAATALQSVTFPPSFARFGLHQHHHNTNIHPNADD